MLLHTTEFMGKKSGGLFKFGGGGKEKAGLLGGGKKVKNTILLALGYVTSYAQPKYTLHFLLFGLIVLLQLLPTPHPTPLAL